MGNTSSAAVAKKRAFRLPRLGWYWIGYLFILPWIITFLFLDLLPLLINIYLGFTNYSLGRKLPQWVGLENYRTIFFGDNLIPISAANTLYWVVLSVPIGLAVALAVALLLNANLPGRGVFRTIFYIPTLVPVVASAVLWRIILGGPRAGVINGLLNGAELPTIRFLTDPALAKPSLILMSVWGFGAGMVIFLAGLQDIPQELYEAADIDGASGWHKFRQVTLPLLTPTIFFTMIMGMIGAFQVFANAYLMTGGGPLQSTLFYMLHLYNNVFVYYKMGYGAAMALLLFIVIMVITVIFNSTSGRWVHYLGEK